ncbi:MAG: selenide, water dikinase SelD [Bacteroidota bacterium]
MNETNNSEVKLTSYSHGAGCGCKISPSILSRILSGNETHSNMVSLLVGNHSRDDAAVLDMGNGTALISTTDFFMPIVDDPYDFGRIAATNAISDVYAMGGKPVLAIAILGWPIDKLEPEVAGRVIAGGRKACEEAGIPLAGGHSIDSPEPIFGLAVNGTVDISNIKRNDTAKEGDLLFLTKSIGIGTLATASKKGLLKSEDLRIAVSSMTSLNTVGYQLGFLDGVHSMTDVTGFGLAGHLIEMAEGSGLTASLYFDKIPVIPSVWNYIDQGCIPGGTNRNWKSYGHHVSNIGDRSRLIIADPQTSGGLLVAVDPDSVERFKEVMIQNGITINHLEPIGIMTSFEGCRLIIN